MTRKRSATTNNSKDKATATAESGPIDENEQEEIVKNLQLEAMQQTKNIGRALQVVCGLAASVSLSSAYFHMNEIKSTVVFVYVLYASAMHFFAAWVGSRNFGWYLFYSLCSTKITEGGLTESKIQSIGIASVTIPILSIIFSSSNETVAKSEPVIITLPWLLAVGNVLTMISAVIIRRGYVSTMNDLRQLEKAKYSYKSL